MLATHSRMARLVVADRSDDATGAGIAKVSFRRCQ